MQTRRFSKRCTFFRYQSFIQYQLSSLLHPCKSQVFKIRLGSFWSWTNPCPLPKFSKVKGKVQSKIQALKLQAAAPSVRAQHPAGGVLVCCKVQRESSSARVGQKHQKPCGASVPLQGSWASLWSGHQAGIIKSGLRSHQQGAIKTPSFLIRSN